MAAFTKISFSGKIDSKGRITVPARIRNKLGLENGDKISLSLESGKIISKEFNSDKEVLEYLSSLENVKSFSFDRNVLEVVLDE